MRTPSGTAPLLLCEGEYRPVGALPLELFAILAQLEVNRPVATVAKRHVATFADVAIEPNLASGGLPAPVHIARAPQFEGRVRVRGQGDRGSLVLAFPGSGYRGSAPRTTTDEDKPGDEYQQGATHVQFNNRVYAVSSGPRPRP